MKWIFKIAIFVFFIAAVCACAKDDAIQNVYEETPAFYVKGMVEADSINLTAGSNNYELTTDFVLDEDSVLMLRGKLADPSGQSKKSVSIWYRTEYTGVDAASALNPNFLLERQPYAISNSTAFSAIPGTYNIQAVASNTGAASYQWLVNGTSYTGYSTTINVSNNNMLVPVSLTTTNALCTSEVTHYIDQNLDCDGSFYLSWLADNKVVPVLELRGSTLNPIKVEWFLQDTLVALSSFSNLTINYNSPVKVSCKLYFADGCVKQISRTVNASAGIIPSCSADFTYTIEPQTANNPLQLSTFEIVYVDEFGKRFTSNHNAVGGSFQIFSINDYRENQDGYPTKRFSFAASAQLQAADGTKLKLKELFGHFAVAYPN